MVPLVTGWSVVIATRPIGTARAGPFPTVLTGARGTTCTHAT